MTKLTLRWILPAAGVVASMACDGAEEGAACAFDLDDHEVTGTCRLPPQPETLACVPADHRPPPRDDGDGDDDRGGDGKGAR